MGEYIWALVVLEDDFMGLHVCVIVFVGKKTAQKFEPHEN